jgi:hypothetical protein
MHNADRGKMFIIARALKGHISDEEREIFGQTAEYDSRIGPANRALQFYNFQIQSYRKAVDCWTLVGLRNKFCKDIRILVRKMIWRSREDLKYNEILEQV